MAFGAAFTAKSDFGMSMVVAPAYILHLKISELLPWFSFGIAEYCVQGLLVLLTAIIMRRFRLSYLFSFITAVIYGAMLDVATVITASLPTDLIYLRIIWFVIGTFLCSLGVSLFFHTYLPPEAYELVVKEISANFSLNINRVKICYDITSTAVSVALSFICFGFGVFKGIGIGTFISATVNGILISRFSRLLEHCFIFKINLRIRRFFN
jgi:uncharacterized membrane protein YczE